MSFIQLKELQYDCETLQYLGYLVGCQARGLQRDTRQQCHVVEYSAALLFSKAGLLALRPDHVTCTGIHSSVYLLDNTAVLLVM